ncbi:MAG: peptide chain release factor N(5)-glutamine methyltransferase, partial [Gemmatimonadota bacterium]
VRAVIRGAAGRLREGGALFLEIAADQGDAVRGILESDGVWKAIDIRRDFAGRDRFAIAQF